MKQQMINESLRLYRDIDSCISKLLKARSPYDAESEMKAFNQMEGLMVGTLQHLSYMIDHLKDVEFTKWIKVEEALPEEGVWVLISQQGVNVELGQYVNGVWWDDMDCIIDIEPTYWMPIVPPKEDLL